MKFWTWCLLAMTMAVPLFSAEPKSPEALIRSIYEHHQPWNKKEIDLTTRATLSKYFDGDLVNLLVKDAECVEKTKEECRLGFDPILDAQDYEDAPKMDLTLKRTMTKKNECTIAVTFTNLGTRTLVYRLHTTAEGWRVSDIVYPEGHSLKRLLE
jgi:hypothetical protein